ncbi:MAG: hypothetical protein E6Q53_01000 [Candidatus Moraniibacteriota bacterium]|nr:MAG: hypothetical protein E6Q53_01000 [Candidatus Moranbacteria bacterium]
MLRGRALSLLPKWLRISEVSWLDSPMVKQPHRMRTSLSLWDKNSPLDPHFLRASPGDLLFRAIWRYRRSMSSTTEEIKARINIVELVGTYVRLEKSGAHYKACCPFHQ